MKKEIIVYTISDSLGETSRNCKPQQAHNIQIFLFLIDTIFLFRRSNRRRIIRDF